MTESDVIEKLSEVRIALRLDIKQLTKRLRKNHGLSGWMGI